MTAPLTPIYDELVLEKLDTFDPVKCEVVRVCDNNCCQIPCECDARWAGRFRTPGGNKGLTLACTGCKAEIDQACACTGITYVWQPL